MNKYAAPIVLVAALLLSGCSAEQRAAIGYADDQAKAFKDTESQVLMRAPCAMSVGSYWRALNTQQRAAVDLLCGK